MEVADTGMTADQALEGIVDSLGEGSEEIVEEIGEGDGETLGTEEQPEQVEEQFFNVRKPTGGIVDVSENKIRSALKIPEGEQIGKHHAAIYQQMLKMNYNSIEAGKLRQSVQEMEGKWGGVNNFLQMVHETPDKGVPQMMKILKIPRDAQVRVYEAELTKLYGQMGVEGFAPVADDNTLEDEQRQIEMERQRLQQQQMEIQADGFVPQIEGTIRNILTKNSLPATYEDIQDVVKEIYIARRSGMDISPSQAIKRLMSRTQRLTTASPNKLVTPKARQAVVTQQVTQMKQQGAVQTRKPTGTPVQRGPQKYIKPDVFMEQTMEKLKRAKK
ncbi:hypothetical protein [Leptospira johnsonii]|uniref:Uncharacterized protein n=1 Tax=Leptospira johnsonii TaxID=1917820 RepID=A0A2P2D7U2_9LEPT|nr:hypothetical protein [Leptospira johnsonii]GBF40694.1 hypothetical protein LPTSP1_37120 [Leptospira johnsonii]